MTPRVAILGLVFLLVAPALGSREGAFIGYTELKGAFITFPVDRQPVAKLASDTSDVACAGKKVVLTTQYGKVCACLLAFVIQAFAESWECS